MTAAASPQPAVGNTGNRASEYSAISTEGAVVVEAAKQANPAEPASDVTQPDPLPNALPAVWNLVMADMCRRDSIGRHRYGTPLQPHNGRDMLRDAYEEALDLAVYLRACIFERDAA